MECAHDFSSSALSSILFFLINVYVYLTGTMHNIELGQIVALKLIYICSPWTTDKLYSSGTDSAKRSIY